MFRFASRAALAAVSLVALQAQAATNVQFTGTVNVVFTEGTVAAPTTGSTITGWFTMATLAGFNEYQYTDGSTYNEGAAFDDGSTGKVVVAGGAWFSDGTTLSLGGMYNYFGQYLARDGYTNEVQYSAQTYGGDNWAWSVLEVDATDYDGANGLFTDPNGGVSFDQAVDLSNANLDGFFEGSSSTGYYYGYFTPTSITISSVPEPANLALLLAGVGLVGLRARRKQVA